MKSWRIRKLGKFISGLILDYKSLYFRETILRGRPYQNKLKCNKQVVNKVHSDLRMVDIGAG